MPKGDNKCTINCTTELKQFMDSKKGDLERSFHCALAYLQQYKAEFIAKYGQECYDNHVKRYSRTAIQLRDEAAQRNQDFIDRKKRELALREKELVVKVKNAENFEIQTQGFNGPLSPVEPPKDPFACITVEDILKEFPNELRLESDGTITILKNPLGTDKFTKISAVLHLNGYSYINKVFTKTLEKA